MIQTITRKPTHFDEGDVLIKNLNCTYKPEKTFFQNKGAGSINFD